MNKNEKLKGAQRLWKLVYVWGGSGGVSEKIETIFTHSRLKKENMACYLRRIL